MINISVWYYTSGSISIADIQRVEAQLESLKVPRASSSVDELKGVVGELQAQLESLKAPRASSNVDELKSVVGELQAQLESLKVPRTFLCCRTVLL